MKLNVVLKNHRLVLTSQVFVLRLKDIFLPKSKPILISVLYRPPGKPGFIEYLENFYNLYSTLIIFKRK